MSNKSIFHERRIEGAQEEKRQPEFRNDEKREKRISKQLSKLNQSCAQCGGDCSSERM